MGENCKNNQPHATCVTFDNDLFGENPWPGVEKTGVVFFETTSITMFMLQ